MYKGLVVLEIKYVKFYAPKIVLTIISYGGYLLFTALFTCSFSFLFLILERNDSLPNLS